MEQTEGSETLARKIQTPGNYPEESIQNAHNNCINLFYILRQQGNLLHF